MRSARFFDRLESVDVNVVKVAPPEGPNRFRAEMITRSARHQVRVEGEGDTVEHALDVAADRFAYRLKRLSERLLERRRRYPRDAAGGILPPDGDRPVVSGRPEEIPEIVRVRRPAAKPMTPEDAALLMNEQQHSFLVFTNADSGRAEVLYRRRDGRLGLIEAG